jgi:hypothetical protein
MLFVSDSRMRLAGHVVCMGEKRSAYRVLIGKPEVKRPLVRRRFKFDLRETGYVGSDWIHLAQIGDQ